MTGNEYQKAALRTASLTGKNKKVSPMVEILLERKEISGKEFVEILKKNS